MYLTDLKMKKEELRIGLFNNDHKNINNLNGIIYLYEFMHEIFT
jgi:hypothetical protein